MTAPINNLLFCSSWLFYFSCSAYAFATIHQSAVSGDKSLALMVSPCKARILSRCQRRQIFERVCLDHRFFYVHATHFEPVADTVFSQTEDMLCLHKYCKVLGLSRLLPLHCIRPQLSVGMGFIERTLCTDFPAQSCT